MAPEPARGGLAAVVIVRCTKKLATLLGRQAQPERADPGVFAK